MIQTPIMHRLTLTGVQIFDSVSWMICMSMVLYCVFWAIA